MRFAKCIAKLAKTALNTTTPLILNIEAATDVCSVCLSHGAKLLSLHESSERNEHSKIVTLLIERCMGDSGLSLIDLDAVAVSEGPGSYTSLRVAFSTAKGICYSIGKPLILVNTLAALSHAASEAEKDENALYCSMIDARRMEVYMGLYDAFGEAILKPQPMVIGADSFGEYFSKGQKIIFCGNGAEKCLATLNNTLAGTSIVKNCSSVQIIFTAMKAFLNKNFADTAYAIPLYLKPPNITTPRLIQP